MFQFTCPEVKNQVDLLRICKLCHLTDVIIKQTLRRKIKDSVFEEATIIRLKCKSCKYSFRVYPQGIREYSSRSKRLVFLGVLLYAAGLSYEKASGFLNGMVGRNVTGFVTIWRDVQQIGEKLRRRRTGQQRVRNDTPIVVGLDGTYVRVGGVEQPIILATNTIDGTTVTVSLGNEWREKELRVFLHEVSKEIGLKNIKGLVTDDLDSYKLLSEKHKIIHQVCVAHVRKNMQKRLKKLENKIPNEYLQIAKDILSSWDNKKLQNLRSDPKLWYHPKKQCKSWIAFRMIISDLLRDWNHYTAYLTNPTIPSTNNRTEQAIGRSKIRYRLTRGFKSKDAVLNFFALTQATGMHRFQQIAMVC